MAVFAGFCWLAWTNRPISLWCLAAFGAAFAGFAATEKYAKRTTLAARTGAASFRSASKLALGIGVAAAGGWIVQIVLNICRSRTNPDAVLDVEACFYDLAEAIEKLLSPSVIAGALGGSLVLALVLNTWAPLHWSNRGRRRLSWISAVLVGAISISFVSIQEGTTRQQFTLAPIRASIGTDLTELRDARRRRAAAQWLTAEMARDLPKWNEYARKGSEACSIVNDAYRKAYRLEAIRSDLAPYDQEPRSVPCDAVEFATFVANAVARQSPVEPAANSEAWVEDERAFWGGAPSTASMGTGASTVDDTMVRAADTSDSSQLPAKLTQAALKLIIRDAKQVEERIKKEAEDESDAATAWEAVASSFLASTGGEIEHDYRGALIKAWVDLLAERVASESGELIAERLKLARKTVTTPREAVGVLATLPMAVFPLDPGTSLESAKGLRSTLGAAIERYLPDADSVEKLTRRASIKIVKKVTVRTGRPADIHNAAGEIIGTVTAQPVWEPGLPGYGAGRHLDPPRPEFHGMP